MTTSYTNTLKFGQPGTGDTGWGRTINEEMILLVEEAIAGRVTINSWGGNTHTLTSANGSTAESRAAILNLTDTGGAIGAGATATVIVPANPKMFSVVNGTGHSVIIKTASGSGVTVTNNGSINVMCDGTNVIEAGQYIAAAKMRTLETEHLATLNSMKLEATSTEIARIEEAMRDAADHTAMMTELAIKNYVNSTGSIRKTERIYPWSSISGSNLGRTPPIITITDDNVTTVATFEVHGDSATQYQEVDISINGITYREGSGHSSPPYSSVVARVQRKSKSATGSSIGTVAVADAKLGGSNSYWYSIQVAGDQTNKIDAFTSISTASNGSDKKIIQNATYDDSTNRTTIIYDNTSSGTGLFSGTGGTVYVSASRFESTGNWVTAIPYYVDSYGLEAANVTADLSEYVQPDTAGNAFGKRRTVIVPKLKLAPNGSAGDVEMRVQIQAGFSAAIGAYKFYALQVDQTNVTRNV